MTEANYTIFHATDLHPDGGIAFRHSVALARDTGAKLVTVHARVPGESNDLRPMPDAGELMEKWSDAPTFEYDARLHECCDDPVDTLLDAVRRVDPNLLVVGTHQRGAFGRLLADSVSNSLAVNARVPTLFLPIGQEGFVTDGGALTISKVLIPVGNDEDFQSALRVVADLVERLGRREVEFHLLHAGESGVVEYEFAPEHAGWTWVRQTVADGDVTEAITDYIDEHSIDLVAMATRGQDGLLDVLRGTHAQRTLYRTHCPLLVVPE